MSILDNALQGLLQRSIAIERLWKNASPDSNFPGQEVPLNWSQYDFIVVHLRHYVGAEYTSVNIMRPKEAFVDGFLNSTLPVANNYLYLYGRIYQFTENGISLGNGYGHDTNLSTATQGNQFCIPLEIFGVTSLSLSNNE